MARRPDTFGLVAEQAEPLTASGCDAFSIAAGSPAGLAATRRMFHPYTFSAHPIAPGDYRATILVTR